MKEMEYDPVKLARAHELIERGATGLRDAFDVVLTGLHLHIEGLQIPGHAINEGRDDILNSLTAKRKKIQALGALLEQFVETSREISTMCGSHLQLVEDGTEASADAWRIRTLPSLPEGFEISTALPEIDDQSEGPR